MKTSQYFARALFEDARASTEDLFEARSDIIFEPVTENSLVDVHLQCSNASDDGEDAVDSKEGSYLGKVGADAVPPYINCPKSSTPSDWCNVREEPPLYVRKSGLQLQSVSRPQKLRDMALVG